MNYESGAQRLAALLAVEVNADGSRNESTTRTQVIDVLIYECLTWDRRDVITEPRFDGKYADYILGRAFKHVIVEAKREGKAFNLPAGLTGGIHKLRTLLDSNREIADAINQVKEYCQERSIPIGVVCNGHQLIAFLASRQDNVPILSGKAIVFVSLADMRARFQELWDCLSPAGVETRYLFKVLQIDGVQPAPEKLALRLTGYPGFKNRNPFQQNLKNLAEVFIEDLGRASEVEEEFLRACYASSGALSHYTLLSKNILASPYPSSYQQELAVDIVASVTTSKDEISPEFRLELLSKSEKRRPIVLLGDVGVGKTIFLRNLIKVEARKELEKAIVFYIDFLKEPALESDLQSFIMRRFEEILLSDYGIDTESDGFVRGVYSLDLLRFENSFEATLKEVDPPEFKKRQIELLRRKLEDKPNHLYRCIDHISKAQNRLIVICLDNIDQKEDKFQESVFQIGHSLAQTWPANVFISLRPSTFYQSRREGVLAAYQPRVFTVPPPRLDEVINKRLQYAIDQLTVTGRVGNTKQWLSVDSTSLTTYLETLVDSFMKSGELIESLDNMSAGNVREAIQFIIAFIGSGHVNAEKIIEKHTDEQRRALLRRSGFPRSKRGSVAGYVIPVHEFLRAIIYGDHIYYDPKSSPVCNVLDITSSDGREHFLLLNILSFMERNGKIDEGFVRADEVFSFAQSIGFDPSQVHAALDRASSKRLIEPNPKFVDTPTRDAYRLTSVGMYTFTRLTHHFVYLDAMVTDTPITDPITRSAISSAEHIDKRVARARKFATYLNDQWKKLEESPVMFDWTAAYDALQANMDQVEVAAERAKRQFESQRGYRL
jgi:GTPase SAR1 family protein